MARLLQRLGSFSVRRRRLVLAAWLIGVITLGGLAASLKGTFSDQFKVPGTESQQAIELIQRNVPNANAEGASGRVVFASKQALDQAGLKQAVARLEKVPDVASVSAPVTSRNGRIAYADLLFSIAEADVSAAQTDAIAKAAHGAAPQVEYGGSAAPIQSEAPIGEALGAIVPPFVLAVNLRPPVASRLPL